MFYLILYLGILNTNSISSKCCEAEILSLTKDLVDVKINALYLAIMLCIKWSGAKWNKIGSHGGLGQTWSVWTVTTDVTFSRSGDLGDAAKDLPRLCARLLAKECALCWHKIPRVTDRPPCTCSYTNQSIKENVWSSFWYQLGKPNLSFLANQGLDADHFVEFLSQLLTLSQFQAGA